MRKIIFIIIVCMAVPALQAESIRQPKNPNVACAEAWQNYQKADAVWKTGWGLFGSGLGLGVAGAVMFPIGAFGNTSSPSGNPKAKAVAISGLTFVCVGAGMVTASVPCLIVGQIRRQKALRSYNENCSSEPPLTFSIQTSSNGIGLAMQF